MSVLNIKVARLEKDRFGTTLTKPRDLETASSVNEVATPTENLTPMERDEEASMTILIEND